MKKKEKYAQCTEKTRPTCRRLCALRTLYSIQLCVVLSIFPFTFILATYSRAHKKVIQYVQSQRQNMLSKKHKQHFVIAKHFYI